jgi:hypothetical protein
MSVLLVAAADLAFALTIPPFLPERFEQVVFGAIGMGFAVAGFFFLRFWRQTRDRLFALFALAFFVLALNRFGIALVEPHEPNALRGDYLYWVRLLAFALILLAIADKNRSQRSSRF